MLNRRMYISFKIRTCPDPEYATIYMRLQQAGHRVEFSLDLKIKRSKWDTKKNQVRGNPEIGDLLTSYETKARQIVLLQPGLALVDVRNAIFGPKPVPPQKPRAKNVIEIGLLLLEKKNRKFEMGQLATNTIRKARERQRNLEWIFETTGWSWPLNDIRTQHMDELELWLRNRTDWHWNTVSKILNFVKEVIRFGMAEGLIATRPLVLRVTFIETEHHALTADQVRQIESMDWKNRDIQAAVDCFLFQCYTGLAYADLRQFKPELHLKVKSLTEVVQLKRAKSPLVGKSYLANVPLLPAAKRILEKYNYRLDVLANQNYNPYLHLVGDRIGLDWTLTSHVARKSFCTILYNAGLSIQMIGEWVGHSTAKTTLAHYAKGEPGSMKKEVQMLGFGT